MAANVVLEQINKSYGANKVLKDFNMTVAEGELVALLGASGCGKTTALRIIAGFLTPETGRVFIGGEEYTHIAPNLRNTAMVFQSYALFPHMSVRENIRFGLKMHKVSKTEINERTEEILTITHLEELADRYPRQLSGGQQQRVALARALVMRPQVLLLDEPLSNLDAKLRREMRVEIRLLQEKFGLTTVFVTHDQEEALTMADRILVMNLGEICQSGSPRDVFDRPRTRYVADFTAVRNFFDGELNGGAFVTARGTRLRVLDPPADFSCIGVRPGKILLDPPESDTYANRLTGTVKISTFLGDSLEVIAVLPDGEELIMVIPAVQEADRLVEKGKQITFGWKNEDMLYLI